MWGDGGRAEEEDNEESNNETEEEQQRHARIAASALAAFGNPNVDAVNAAARLRAFEQASYEYPLVAQSNRSLLFQSQAVEALRRQEELQLRQQALYTLQQQQVLQRQELQELEYARQLQQQRVAELAARTRQDVLSGSHEGLSVFEALGRASAAPAANEARLKTDDQEEETTEPQPAMDESGKYLAIAPRGKPEAMATAIAAARMGSEEEEPVATAVPMGPMEIAVPEKQATPTKKKPSRKRKASTSPGRSKKKAAASHAPTLNDPVPPITDVDYENVEALMEQFCKVPLLAEFSRPVALLHPEVCGVWQCCI